MSAFEADRVFLSLSANVAGQFQLLRQNGRRMKCQEDPSDRRYTLFYKQVEGATKEPGV